eukprot:m.36433 g.36433  ORF g.36433 m.36433 type:complete len:636 (+) comp5409_c0_seq1:2445-4352(+)
MQGGVRARTQWRRRPQHRRWPCVAVIMYWHLRESVLVTCPQQDSRQVLPSGNMVNCPDHAGKHTVTLRCTGETRSTDKRHTRLYTHLVSSYPGCGHLTWRGELVCSSLQAHTLPVGHASRVPNNMGDTGAGPSGGERKNPIYEGEMGNERKNPIYEDEWTAIPGTGLLQVPKAQRHRSGSNASTSSHLSHVLVLEEAFPGISSVTASSFTFTNFIIQPANPANLPVACQQAGLVCFPLLVILFGAINCFTCDLLAEAIDVVGADKAVGMAELLSVHFGRVGWHAGAWSVILANFGSLVFTIILIGDMITPIVGLGTSNETLCSNWPWIVIVSTCVLSPMAFIKNMSQLDEASQVAVTILITLVGCLIGYAIYLAAEPDQRLRFGDSSFLDECTAKHVPFMAPGDTYYAGPRSLAFFGAFSNLAFSFNAQANVFPLYAELKERSPARMKQVNYRAMMLSGIIFVLSGMFGYIAFLDATKSNSVQNFPVQGHFGYFMDAVRLLLAVSLVTSYPLTLWECREHLEQMIAREADTDRIKDWKRLGMSWLLIAVSTGIAIAAKDVGVVFGFFGATACPILMFVLPCLNHLKMNRPGVKQIHIVGLGDIYWTDWKDKTALSILIMSFLLIPLALYAWGVAL